MLRAGIIALVITAFLVIGTTSPVWGAQLSARLNPDIGSSEIEIKYQRTIFIEYPEGGEIADELRGKSWKVEATADSSDSGVKDIIQALNQKITSDGSSARITDMGVEYSAELTGRGLNTSIDYKIILTPTLSFFIIRGGTPDTPALIDAAWRGLTAQGSFIVDGKESNMPISILRTMEPEVSEIIAGTEAEILLSKALIDAQGIKNQPLTNWHFLFDPTGINVDASTFGLSEEISGFVVSSFTMGESSFREGIQVERIEEVSFTADREYTVRSIQSSDSAEISLIGFAAIDTSYGAEAFGVSPTPPEGYATTATGDFPIMIVYGMAGMAAVGGVVFMVMSSRKLKKEVGMGQQGIDPSLLRGVATSAGSGGYQTVRGEAQLIEDVSYEQTKSVYEEEKKEEETSSQSTKGSLPKGWKPS